MRFPKAEVSIVLTDVKAQYYLLCELINITESIHTINEHLLSVGYSPRSLYAVSHLVLTMVYEVDSIVILIFPYR